MKRPFRRRRRDGKLVVTLAAPIADVVQRVLAEMGDVVASPIAGPVNERLFPRAYLDPTEEDAEQLWQSAVHDDLLDARVAAFAATGAELQGARSIAGDRVEIVLDTDAEQRWLTVVNDVRLALGTTLGVTEEEPLEYPDDDPRAPGAEVYHLFTALQAELVDVLLEELPERGSDDDLA